MNSAHQDGGFATSDFDNSAAWTTEDFQKALRTISDLKRERDEALERIDELEAKTIHSCHDQCQRPGCVRRRENEAMRGAIKVASNAIKLQIFVRGTRDDTLDVLAQMQAALTKLQPFLK
jgi:hypothetical protein